MRTRQTNGLAVDDSDTVFFGPGAFDSDVIAEAEAITIDTVHDGAPAAVPVAGN